MVQQLQLEQEHFLVQKHLFKDIYDAETLPILA
jgi:hypothetical protein